MRAAERSLRASRIRAAKPGIASWGFLVGGLGLGVSPVACRLSVGFSWSVVSAEYGDSTTAGSEVPSLLNWLGVT